MFKINIADKTGAVVDIDSQTGEPTGVVVSTRSLKKYENTVKFFANSTYGVDLNIDASAGGTPEKVHDGIDSSLWTATDIVGGAKTTFDDSTHAYEGIITVVDYSIIDPGDSFTINATTRTEGTDWTAETSNTVTASNIATDITDNVTGFSATSSSGIVTVTSDPGYDITVFSTNADIDEMTATGQSIEVAGAAVNDTFQFDKGSDLDCTGYVSLTVWVYVDKSWAAGDSVSIYGWDTGTGLQIGTTVYLQNYFEWDAYDVWHKITIPLTDMGALSNSTTLDALRIKIETVAPVGPTFYLDQIQFEQTGTPIKYSLTPEKGTWLHVHSFTFSFVDDVNTLALNSTMPKFTYNKILGETLIAGVNYQRVQDGEVKFSTTSKSLMDMAQLAGTEWGMYGSADSLTFLTLNHVHTEPFILKPESEDELSFTVAEDLTGLIQFRVSAGCKIEYR